MASSVTPEPGHVWTDSQSLAELSTMFPDVEYTVLVSVLQAHNGRLDTAVEYFMENSHSTHVHHIDHPVDIHDDANAGHLLDDPSRDMIGQFSGDIGGLPEMLPNFIYNAEDTQSSSDEDSEFLQHSPTPDSDIDSEDDPLPTYEEACTDADRLPEAVYIQDDVRVVNDVVEMPREAHLEERTSDPVPIVREKTKKGESIIL